MAVKKQKHRLNGVRLLHLKNTKDYPAQDMPLPEIVRIPMLQHMGVACEPIVKKGDSVTVGQKIGDSDAFLSAPVHSSVSGIVEGIDEIPGSAGGLVRYAVIKTDGRQTLCDDIAPPQINSLSDLIKAVRESGLVGLGGAGFPTHVKFSTDKLSRIDTLVVNGAECEPYITSDNRTMLDFTQDIIDGIGIITEHLEISNAYIGIDDNKPMAIKKLSEAASGYEGIRVVKLKSAYPQGAEKVIIYAATGRVVSEGELPADAGVLVMNVSSVAFVARYIKTGIPLINKTVTVDGGAVKSPKNVNVLIGTPIKDVLNFCDCDFASAHKILMGGPMMGISVYDTSLPVIKNNNAILAFTEKQAKTDKTTACIKCGKCNTVCPVKLMPASLEKAHDANNIDLLKELHVNLCINCGCCSYICPAKRSLAQKNQLSKQLLKKV